MNEIKLSHEGRRIYILGNTYPIKESIKSAGGNWDGDRKAWWVGSSKKEAIEKAVANMSASHAEDESEELKSGRVHVKGKVEYKGRKYYLMAESRDGSCFKVCPLDGAFSFWAKTDAGAKIIKRFQESRSLLSIRRFIEDGKRLEKKSAHGDAGWRNNGCAECRRLQDWCPRCAFDEFDN